jgi:hypothetical protein
VVTVTRTGPSPFALPDTVDTAPTLVGAGTAAGHAAEPGRQDRLDEIARLIRRDPRRR